MNALQVPSHEPESPMRRLLLRVWFAALVAHTLTACDDGRAWAQDIPKKWPTPAPTTVPSPKADELPAETLPNPYPLPNNQFEVLPAVKPLDPAFLARVEKITLEERKKQLMSVNGGGKASDEVDKLQKLWLRPFNTLTEIKQAFEAKKLISLPSISEGRYFAIGLIGEADPDNKFWYHLIHPDAYNRFNTYVAKVFYAKTGKMLKVCGLVRSEEYQAKLRKGNIQATKKTSPHEFGRTIDFSIPQVFDPQSRTMVPMSPEERTFISRLLTYYEKGSPERTSWLVEGGNAYHGTHYPILKK